MTKFVKIENGFKIYYDYRILTFNSSLSLYYDDDELYIIYYYYENDKRYLRVYDNSIKKIIFSISDADFIKYYNKTHALIYKQNSNFCIILPCVFRDIFKIFRIYRDNKDYSKLIEQLSDYNICAKISNRIEDFKEYFEISENTYDKITIFDSEFIEFTKDYILIFRKNDKSFAFYGNTLLGFENSEYKTSIYRENRHALLFQKNEDIIIYATNCFSSLNDFYTFKTIKNTKFITNYENELIITTDKDKHIIVYKLENDFNLSKIIEYNNGERFISIRILEHTKQLYILEYVYDKDINDTYETIFRIKD